MCNRKFIFAFVLSIGANTYAASEIGRSINITPWTPYTITISSTGSQPSKGTTTNDVARWRRVGDTMEISYFYLQTAGGSPGSGIYLFDLPSSTSIDSNKVFLSTDAQVHTNVGYSSVYDRYPTAYSTFTPGHMWAYDSTHLAMVVAPGATSGAWAALPPSSSYEALNHYPLSYQFFARIPISGWE